VIVDVGLVTRGNPVIGENGAYLRPELEPDGISLARPLERALPDNHY
jgi:hypothetical protein